MLEIVFPSKLNQRYYEIHFRYLLNIFKYAGCNISYYDREDDALVVKVNGGEVNFSYWDDSSKLPTYQGLNFQYHCVKETENIKAFTPVSFYDWEQYFQLSGKLIYNARGPVSCRQRPYGGALQRRKDVILKLKDHLGEGFVYSQIPYLHFLEDVENISISVCVPGFCNNMLDRGHIQVMALGCCTISPNIPDLLPFGQKLEPDFHYVQCRDDYSDLLDVINWCKNNPLSCKYIGRNAKKLFENTSTPEKLIEWVRSQCDIYNNTNF